MRKLLYFALGAAMMLSLGILSPRAEAQVYADYDLSVVNNKPFEALVEGSTGVTVKNASDFWVMPTKIQNSDDGYCEVTMPFNFNFNGVDYNKFYISINGFITFNTPPNVVADQPQALFTIENSYADNVIAPYWGDHYYRTATDNAKLNPGDNRWAPSKILVYTSDNKVVVEWRDMNVFVDPTPITSSVATFQVILYKSTDPLSNQGVIEFAYGTNGRKTGQQTSETTVITNGASIGIKGESGIIHHSSDYINALKYASDKMTQISTPSYSEIWQPTGGSDYRFRFQPNIRYAISSRWGDGDADMSRVAGQKHQFISDQNRYVTVSDARAIINSIATNVPLDSVKGRAAFHGDVNHNGRFIYTADGQKYNIYWRNREYNDSLPLSLIGSEKQLMFQVTEYDAAVILHYLAARIPYLPWVLDTIPKYGKMEVPATAVVIGSPEGLTDGSYIMPVYVNGYIDGAIGSKFDINGEVEDVTAADEGLSVEYNGQRVVIAGSAKFNSGEALAYVTFRSNDKNVKVTNITYNDNQCDDAEFMLAGVDDQNVAEMLNNWPNPFSASTTISVNAPNNGFYTLNIYDIQGNLVKTLLSENMTKGLHTYLWNGTNNAGNKVESGLYIYRFVGDNLSISNTMQIVK